MTMDDKQINKGKRSDLHEGYVRCGEKATITDLNDACLERIFENVRDLVSQIKIAKCCLRFRDVVIALWNRQPQRRVMNYRELRTWVHYDDLKYYLTVMRTQFHTIKITGFNIFCYLLEMKDIGIQYFPCVERCELNGVYTEGFPCDEAVGALSKMVPNLKYLHLMKPVRGKYLKNFQYLEELHLFDRHTIFREIETKHLGDILLNLKHLRVLDLRAFFSNKLRLGSEISQCSKLEVLKLNSKALRPVLKYVLQLPQLKQLKVRLDYREHRERRDYHKILRHKGPQIQGIAVDFLQIRATATWSTVFSRLQLEHLKLLALSHSLFNVMEYEQYQYSRLEIFCLRDSQFRTIDILKMIHLCPVLQHLDISFNEGLSITLLKEISNYWQKLRPNKVLCLYYYHTTLGRAIQQDYDFWAVQKHLKLIDGVLPDSDIDSTYVKGFAFYFSSP